MIQLPQGFKVNAKEPIDVRLILTKAEMLIINDSIMPDMYFAICKDDGKLYVYNKANEQDDLTGKYRLYGTDTSSTASVSKEEGNIIEQKSDGLFVSENESISDETIKSLFPELNVSVGE